jgi:hypothetical protein
MGDGDERRKLRHAVAAALGQLGLPLRLIAEDVLGEEDGAIDWIGAATDGRAWLVLVDPAAEGGALLERALVQRAWVAARLPDWCQLAPSLGLRPDLAPRVLVVAAELPRTTRIAAREVGGDAITLSLLRRSAHGDGAVELARVVPPPPPRRETAAAPARLRSVFRSNLSDADLAS